MFFISRFRAYPPNDFGCIFLCRAGGATAMTSFRARLSYDPDLLENHVHLDLGNT
jgi:hypothetical protein